MFELTHVHQVLTSVGLAMARIGPSFFLLPFFSGKIVGTGVVRMSLLTLLAFAFAGPYEAGAIAAIPAGVVFGLALKEGLVGLVLGLVFAMPYIAALTCGEFLDSQRGATMANTIDPASDVEASTLATFTGLFWAAIFTLGGGWRQLLEVLAESYRVVPLDAGFVPTLSGASQLATLLAKAMMAGIVAASPAIAVLLLTEILLAVLYRFAEQLSGMSAAMTVKSILACATLLIYIRTDGFASFNTPHAVSLRDLLLGS